MHANIVPLPRTPALLVQRAARALRAGQPVTLRASRGDLQVLPAEATPGPAGPLPEGSFLALTGQRLASLTGTGADTGTWRVPLPPGTPPALLTTLSDPTAPVDPRIRALAEHAEPGDEVVAAAVELC